MSKETFKLFARNHPELARQVINEKASWQKLYELYEIYGEKSNVWDDFTKSSATRAIEETTSIPGPFKELFNTFKNIDLDSVQKGVTNLQKTIGMLQDIGLGGSTTSEIAQNVREYEPRPMYRYFED